MNLWFYNNASCRKGYDLSTTSKESPNHTWLTKLDWLKLQVVTRNTATNQKLLDLRMIDPWPINRSSNKKTTRTWTHLTHDPIDILSKCDTNTTTTNRHNPLMTKPLRSRNPQGFHESPKLETICWSMLRVLGSRSTPLNTSHGVTHPLWETKSHP